MSFFLLFCRICMVRKLVIDGREFPYSTLTAVNFDGDRVALPSRVNDFVRFPGKDAIECWLLVVTAGRYRLLLEPLTAPEDTGILARIQQGWEEYGTPGGVLDGAGSNERAAILARLLPTTVAPMGTGWRVTIPKEAKMLTPASEERSFVFVMVVAGNIEFWFPDTLRRATSIPIAELLS